MDMINMQLYSFIALAVAISVGFSTIISFMLVARVRANYCRQLEKMNTTIGVLTSGSLGMGQKMLALEERLSLLRAEQNEIKQNDLDFSYTQAQKLIAQGVDSRAVAANSGLSATEIGLMQMLHQQSYEAKEYGTV